MTAAAPAADPDLPGLPTPLDIAHRVFAQFVAIVICGVSGAALALAGAMFNFKHARAWTGLIMAGVGLLLLALAWFLLRGAGLRWALRGVVLARSGRRDDDAGKDAL
jgi:hypothetical protein